MKTTQRSVAVILTSLLAIGSVTTMMAADWPSFRGPNHDGKSAESITWPKNGPKQLWKINVGIGHSAVSVLGNRAYTMGNANDTDTVVGGKLLVLTEMGDLVLVEASPDHYKELGSAHVIEGRAFTAPVFANGKAYVRNTRGDVVSLDLSGK